ncbi:FG-GAP-like repeat-containing protein [Streptomyces sp. AP-93]|uniref:FG-GAP-like repeat-containing protein n=1 Tax=Streptomyces sp. AP-93 TaxID=2929048 RepID=UPI001FAF463C|nr:FG-GAP-like repeat-containing protein [Streptomyces sp. AP-93]MCJ0873621.1 FG-GAP-like repeat-containing protein [Streptomyces sp. AP-93]
MRSTKYLTAATCTAAVLAVTGLSPATAAPAAPAATAKPVTKDAADFNGDGYADLAIGAPKSTINGLKRAGLVSIVYGSPTGLRHDKQQLISRATPGIPGEPTDGAGGVESAYGDLNADTYDDLAIISSGKILVLWGSASGISGGTDLPAGAGTTQSPRIETNSLAIGDINGDGKDDLVLPAQVGDPYKANWGMATRFGPFDRTTGKPASAQFRDTQAKDGVSTSGVRVGDMTGDGITDIVTMGTSTQTSGGFKALLLKGTPAGLVQGGALNSRHGGSFGDINGDGYRDFVGMPQAFDSNMTGGIAVTYGGPDGVSKTLPARIYDQDTAGVPGVNEKGDRWGNDVTLGDIDQDGHADLVVGASWESGTDATSKVAGAVTVLRGSKTGLTGTGSQVFTQNSAGIPSASEESDHFGEAVTLLDTNKDGKPELYVGGNGEDNWVGRVWQLQNSGTRLTGTGATSFNLGGGYGSAHFGAWFGK